MCKNTKNNLHKKDLVVFVEVMAASIPSQPVEYDKKMIFIQVFLSILKISVIFALRKIMLSYGRK
jgi:hypothetical protein